MIWLFALLGASSAIAVMMTVTAVYLFGTAERLRRRCDRLERIHARVRGLERWAESEHAKTRSPRIAALQCEVVSILAQLERI